MSGMYVPTVPTVAGTTIGTGSPNVPERVVDARHQRVPADRGRRRRHGGRDVDLGAPRDARIQNDLPRGQHHHALRGSAPRPRHPVAAGEGGARVVGGRVAAVAVAVAVTVAVVAAAVVAAAVVVVAVRSEV